MRHLTASEITESAIKEFSYRGFECWRQNQIRVPGRKFNGKLGLSDIIGYHVKTGVMLACEVKTKDDTFSNEQIDFLMKLKKANGFAMVATEENYHVKIYSFLEYQALKLKL